MECLQLLATTDVLARFLEEEDVCEPAGGRGRSKEDEVRRDAFGCAARDDSDHLWEIAYQETDENQAAECIVVSCVAGNVAQKSWETHIDTTIWMKPGSRSSSQRSFMVARASIVVNAPSLWKAACLIRQLQSWTWKAIVERFDSDATTPN